MSVSIFGVELAPFILHVLILRLAFSLCLLCHEMQNRMLIQCLVSSEPARDMEHTRTLQQEETYRTSKTGDRRWQMHLAPGKVSNRFLEVERVQSCKLNGNKNMCPLCLR